MIHRRPSPLAPIDASSPPYSHRALACWDCRPSPEWIAEYFTASHPRLVDARPQHIRYRGMEGDVERARHVTDTSPLSLFFLAP